MRRFIVDLQQGLPVSQTSSHADKLSRILSAGFAQLAFLAAGWLLCAGVIDWPHRAQAAEKPATEKPAENPENKSVSKKRLDIMQAAMDSFAVQSKEIQEEVALKIGQKPVLRYDDQVRNLLDAGVWRIGDGGRATAYVTIELYGVDETTALLTYEFISLSKAPFSMISKRGPAWSPGDTDFKPEVIQEARAPGDSESSRLTQMREIVRRFRAIETYRGEKIELRLLPQPIDRYRNQEKKITDGAVFVFANGTNPEMGMAIETDGKRWSYGIFRLSTAPIDLELDGKSVPGIPPNAAHGVSRPYTATRHSVKLPQ